MNVSTSASRTLTVAISASSPCALAWLDEYSPAGLAGIFRSWPQFSRLRVTTSTATSISLSSRSAETSPPRGAQGVLKGYSTDTT
jgi:hypothetical protein